MINKYLLPLFIFFFIGHSASAQSDEAYRPYFKDLRFEQNPVNKAMPESDTTSYGVGLGDKTIIEFFYDDEGNLMEYRTYYTKVKLNTERAIREYNQVYINMNNAKSLVRAKARVIKADNTTVNLKQSDIKEAENFEEYGHYKYFAYEGIEKGVDIEYMYTLLQEPSYSGNRAVFQGNAESNDVEFILIAPTNLEFDFKSLNNFPEVLQDTTDTNRNYYSASIESIRGVTDETYSAGTVSMMSLLYKLESNEATGEDKLVNYSNAAQNAYSNMHLSIYSDDKKALNGMTKKLKLSKLSEEEQLRNIEHYIKSNINVVDQSGAEFYDISEILVNKNASSLGIMRMYINWIELLEIEYQMGIASSRKEVRFEKDFESYNCLGDYFIYFPNIDKYIAPDFWTARIGYLPHKYTHNYALFMRPIRIGEFDTYLSEVKWIEAAPLKFTYSDLDIGVNLGDAFEQPQVDLKITRGGYEASMFQSSFEMLSPEDKESLETVLITFFGDEETIIEKSYENTDPKRVYVEPFIINAKLDYPNMVEKAGPKYLVKIGKLIGPQFELYQEKQRELDIEIDYKHSYTRDIEVKIPAGYRVANLDDLNFDVTVDYEGEKTMSFISSYQQEGDAVKVHIYEHYDQIQMPKSHYKEFRDLVNAAADFNKVVLVFEKI